MAEGRDTSGRFVAGSDHPRNGGRKPSRRRIEPLLQRIGEEELDYQGGTITKLEAVMRAVFNYALKGQSWAVQFIAERTEGKVRDTAVDSTTEPKTIHILTYDGDATIGAEDDAA